MWYMFLPNMLKVNPLKDRKTKKALNGFIEEVNKSLFTTRQPYQRNKVKVVPYLSNYTTKTN